MSVYAISDLHGYYAIYQEVKKFLRPEDKVFFLGDAADRGSKGWELIKAIYEDPQFEYIMGNHEHMLLHAMREYKTGEMSDFYPDGGVVICKYNGGTNTFNAWQREKADGKWLNYLNKLPRQKEYVNKDGHTIHLSHAGYAPGVISTEDDLLWDRRHFNYNWPEDEEYKKLIIVHGHTPVQYLNESWEKEDGIITYCDGHKIDIDCGTYLSKMACLLDLDTFDEHYFFAE